MTERAGTFRIAHLVDLSIVGGIERMYSQFVNFGFEQISVEHHTILARGNIATLLKDTIQKGSKSISHFNSYKFAKIPKRPRMLRDDHQRRILNKVKPDIILSWSSPNSIRMIPEKAGVKVVYYEHGASWLKRDKLTMIKLFREVFGIICCSFAAKRILELKWNADRYTKINVCLNAIMPDCLPVSVKTKKVPKDRPFRVGIAGRQAPEKGFPLVMHAFYKLKKRGIPCELLVAGTGKELENLKSLSRKLDLEKEIIFIGFVNDMSEFFSNIDCFICPSIREPFGLVCAEAMAHGCPVIATKVDGLPEVVQDSKTGFCITPTLPIEDYAAFGGSIVNLPQFVYNPETDSIEPPRLLNPLDITDKIEILFKDKEMYEKMSISAVQIVREKFKYNDHAAKILDLLLDISLSL